MGMFNWRRDPSNPYLPADGNLAQMNANSMEGYKPLNAMTPNGNGMNGYRPNPTPNGFSVPNQQHGGMAQPNLEGYGESLQAASNAAAQAQAREQQIADIQSQIQTLETRIAENQSKLKNWTGNADKIAAIEARKFNSSDPTSIWRWKVDRDEARKIANAEKAKGDELAKQNAQYEIDNELSSMIVDNKMTSNDEKVFLSKLATLRTLAQKSGLPTDKIDTKIKEVKGDTGTVAVANSPEGSKFEGKPREQWTAEANDLLGNKKAKSKDIQAFLDQAGDNLDNDTRIKLNSAYRDLAKKEADKADADAMHAYSEELGFGKWDNLSDRMKETVKRMWKTKKGKK